jgi:hypothetical protein
MNTTWKRSYRHAMSCLAALACLVSAACTTTTPVWDRQVGQAVTAVRTAQILNPQAPEGLPPMVGVDGKAAVAAMTRYDRSLLLPPTGGAGYGSSGGYGSDSGGGTGAFSGMGGIGTFGGGAMR